jgi:hypothetical protein
MTTNRIIEPIRQIGSLARSITVEDEDSQYALSIIMQLCENIEIDIRVEKANERLRREVNQLRQESYERIEEIVDGTSNICNS